MGLSLMWTTGPGWALDDLTETNRQRFDHIHTRHMGEVCVVDLPSAPASVCDSPSRQMSRLLSAIRLAWPWAEAHGPTRNPAREEGNRAAV